MTNNTALETFSTNLNSFDPATLALFCKASHLVAKNGSGKASTKAEMQVVLNSWLIGNSSSACPWEIIDLDDRHSGFQGFAAGRDYDGDGKYDEIVFAFAGTNSLLDKVTSDFQILVNQVPGQANKAEEFYNEVMYTRVPSPLEGISAVFADNINPNAFVTFTGHSLGGTIAQVMAANHNKTTKPPCMIMVDVNGDRKPTPGNVNCKNTDCGNSSNVYKVPLPGEKKVRDIFSIIITEDRAIPYGVTAQKAMYQAQK